MITIFKREDKLPSVVYDDENKTVKIAGIIAPENPIDFFSKLEEEIKNIYKQNNHITIDFQLDYFNTGSARYLYLMLKNLKDFQNTEFIWQFEKDDEDIYESGQELEKLCNIKFRFIEINR
ncbi:MAG TPA: SiaC family regulatory phosphoprotein [Bacteroidales bacterium]|jgi:hypothetical protein|nr:SiaC family regulatory phosphoprotein [Bacteroidales bacterium]HOL98245.1 SiaC family regulatory phosphoprotein [Bacteroidales bacterium]HOM36598.1 SiaC family regulatory phosphoprotein [Bacteroidales bacterium]HPD24024.1 SiaC family regulatory phosphoprotein [Bacteroidales bacterium]HRT00025.1 SiaC family regulatory phosphoprotein [Bacteroidales bacterium]